MASLEHKHHADVVKNTHSTLRDEARTYGAEIAWTRHLKRRDVLRKYAESMRELATLHWKQASSMQSLSTHCRIEWIKQQCMEYFACGGQQKYNERESAIRVKMKVDETGETEKKTIDSNNLNNSGQESRAIKISLLDVGSCYNPFALDDTFDVTAIDLTGIDSSILECDFLNANIGGKRILSENGRQLLQLSANTYDVVVFSLFLEYLPCPRQRFQCCEKAYNLLKPTGILVIATPDSKHVGANASLMKSWRYVLSRMGFMRIKYEKLQHLHCLVFRKCLSKDVAARWASMQTISDDEPLYKNHLSIFIPQDLQSFSKKDINCTSNNSISYNADDLLEGFAELPYE